MCEQRKFRDPALQALKVFANQDGVAIPWDAKPMELSTLIAIQKGVKRKPPKGGQVRRQQRAFCCCSLCPLAHNL